MTNDRWTALCARFADDEIRELRVTAASRRELANEALSKVRPDLTGDAETIGLIITEMINPITGTHVPVMLGDTDSVLVGV